MKNLIYTAKILILKTKQRLLHNHMNYVNEAELSDSAPNVMSDSEVHYLSTSNTVTGSSQVTGSTYSYWFHIQLLVPEELLVGDVIYRIVGSSQFFDSDFPVTFFSQQLVYFIIQIPNPELPETSCTQTGRRERQTGQTERPERDRQVRQINDCYQLSRTGYELLISEN